MADQNDINRIINWASQHYGADRNVLYNIGKLESGFRNVVNNWDSNAKKGTPSAGWFQFIQPTFSAFSRQARAANPNAWKGIKDDWRNPYAQALTTAWAIKNGKGSHWATYQRALGGGAMPGKAAGGQGMGGTTGWSLPGQKITYQVQVPGKPLDTGALARIGQHFKNQPWKIDNLQQPILDAAAPRMKTMTARVGAFNFAGQPGMGGGNVVYGGGVPQRKPGEAGWQYLQRVGQSMFGLRNDPGNYQTTGGNHAANSWHYKNTAIDFGNARNSTAKLNAWYNWLNQNRRVLGIAELLKEDWGGPNGHVHAALRR